MITFWLKLFYSLYFSLSPHCSCIQQSIETEYKKSNAVFLGSILKVDTLKHFEEGLQRGYFRELHLATVKKEKIFKGETKLNLELIVTGAGYGDCGYEFEIGKKYIFYSKKRTYSIIDSITGNDFNFSKSEKSFLYTDICDRTTDSIEIEEKRLKNYLSKSPN